MRQGLHILVTGASGFVGQALARLALEQGHRVTALVREGAQAPAGCDALVHALGSGAPLRLPSGVDVVAHLAQSRAYRAFPGDADEMFRVNVAGAQELLMAAAEGRVSRFCLVSSGTVYESLTRALSEDAAVEPSGNLGATKLAAETIARPFNALFPVSTLRLFSPYGPGQTGRLVPDLIRRVREGEAVTLPAEGGGMRFAPTFVDDICVAMLTAIEESWRGVFNLAAPEVLSIEDATQLIGKALGKTPLIARNPAQTAPAPVLVPDLAKLGTCYDMSRFRPFAAGITETLAARA
jgi:nucleoside-diphosphate-sugar epimerase